MSHARNIKFLVSLLFSRFRRTMQQVFTRKPIAMLQMVYWDEKNVYLEHQFISLTDGFIRAVGLSKQTTFGLKVPVGEVIKALEPEAQLPAITKELQLWFDSMEESSQKLKKRD